MPDEKRMLAERNGLGYVYECSCGTIHVGLGLMDLRMTRQRLVEIHQMLGEAVAQFQPSASATAHPEIGSPKVYSN